MSILPTVTIKTKNGPVEINLTDYDPEKHVLAEASDLTPLKQENTSAPAGLFGSSIQPASWTLKDGSVLQLGTVVAEAHKRSGLTVEEWNAQAVDVIEAAIAEVAEEFLEKDEEVVAAYKIGKNGKRGGASRFVIFNQENVIVGEEYQTLEEAEEALKALQA